MLVQTPGSESRLAYAGVACGGAVIPLICLMFWRKATALAACIGECLFLARPLCRTSILSSLMALLSRYWHAPWTPSDVSVPAALAMSCCHVPGEVAWGASQLIQEGLSRDTYTQAFRGAWSRSVYVTLTVVAAAPFGLACGMASWLGTAQAQSGEVSIDSTGEQTLHCGQPT